MYIKRQALPFIRDLLLDKTETETQEAEERFFQYLELSYSIYKREIPSVENDTD